MGIVSMVRNISRYAVMPASASEFPDVVRSAYNMAMIGRKGV